MPAHRRHGLDQLPVFANVVADHLHGTTDDMVDAWFATWSEPEEAARTTTLSAIAAPDVRMHDRFSSIEGL